MASNTVEPQTAEFLDHVWLLIDFWASPERDGYDTTHERLQGLAHSLLATLDGMVDGVEPPDRNAMLNDEFFHRPWPTNMTPAGRKARGED